MVKFKKWKIDKNYVIILENVKIIICLIFI